MAIAQTSVFSTKLKLDSPLPSMLESTKFFKWTESASASEKNSPFLPSLGTLKADRNCLILYWRDRNQKQEIIDLAYIRDVKTGKYARVPNDRSNREYFFSEKSQSPIQDRTISIYYGYDFCNIQIINFISVDDRAVEKAQTWTKFILKCITNQRIQNLSPWENLIKLKNYLFFGKGVLDNKTKDLKLPVQALIEALGSSGKSGETERQDVLEALQSVGLPHGKNDLMDEKVLSNVKFFKLFVRLISTRDIDPIFLNYSTKTKTYLAPEKFEMFLNKEQRDPCLNELLYPFYTVQKATELIDKFETDDSFRKKKRLSSDGLMRYLMDFENEVVDPVKYELHDDMDQPLTHYFVNSSHNTYLTGHQLTGKSDAEMYRQVLLSGCRCIELDCHEDDTLDEPIITHGRTLCTKILFSEAIEAINESAFKTSPYPVLLSFENFCGKKMQEKMVKYLKDILGTQLLIEPLSQYPLKPGVPLPSPEELKYKILVKFRKKRSEKIQNLNENKESIKEVVSSDYLRSISLIQNPKHSDLHPPVLTTNSEPFKLTSRSDSASILRQLPRGESLQTTDSSDSEKEDQELKKSQVKPSISNSSDSSYKRDNLVTSEMAHLVNYLQPTTFRTFEISQRKNRSYEMSSFVETSALSLHKEKSTDFVNYNKRQFSRIYPKGTRISSDNFIPQIYWNVGCQMVALNFQTLDTGMQLNLGKFEYNNRCGYILKPEIMRRTDVNKLFDPLTDSPVDGIVASTLKIRIISGIYLNHIRGEDKRLGQTVTVELFGLPADSIRGQKAHKVKASSSKLFNVFYSDPNGYSFKKIIMPQLATLKITAYDEQYKFIGYRVLPVVGLRPGYRFICLKNESNQQLLMTNLFVHIQIGDYVPEEYEEFASALVNPINYVAKLTKEEIVRNLTDDIIENPQPVNGLFDLDDESENETSKKSQSVNNINHIDFKGLNNCPSLSNLKPRENRYSISGEKYNQIKKSDLNISKSLSNSMFNIPRSHSLFFNDSDHFDKNRNNLTFLNDPSLFTEIDLELLKKNKSNQQILKACFKKCYRLEKESEKKIKELSESLTSEINRTKTDSVRSKIKVEKKRKLFILKSSKSSLEFDLKNFNLTNTEKCVNKMKSIYEETYTKIMNLKLSCVETLCIRLEKAINEIHENRMQQLKFFSEKEITQINKQTHLVIKTKKKILNESVQDKEELARLSKKIEKESVSYAVNENSKIEELLKVKQKLIKQIVDFSLNNLKDYREKQLILYKNEFIDKISQKKLELDKRFLFDSALNPNAVINSMYSMHLSKSVGLLTQVGIGNDKKISKNMVTSDLSSNENVTRLKKSLTTEIESVFGFNYIFIGGYERSGTTLMRAILDVHDDVNCGPETKIIPQFLEFYRVFYQNNNTIELLNQAGVKRDSTDSADGLFIYRILKDMSKNSKKLCTKDPNILYSMKQLHKIFPQAKFIYMIRDPRAVIYSLKLVFNSTLNNQKINSYLNSWIYYNLNVKKQCDEIGENFCLMVRYEDLVTESIKKIKQIVEFIQLTWTNNFLNHEKYVGSKIIISNTEWSNQQIKRPIHTKSIDLWKVNLESFLKINDNEKNIIKKFGYEI
ncbi:unnamed protein product [Brachionus calyciflorus]|uniref:Phosphoinositide phospholipase C n=1 Tax=Brachionus calyciflorus TaxID=104777 RepID=A0A813U8W1_9BILA|nr:unnamed protein product [Brachionus calyciflorus]